jgi:hypothetical protein
LAVRGFVGADRDGVWNLHAADLQLSHGRRRRPLVKEPGS